MELIQIDDNNLINKANLASINKTQVEGKAVLKYFLVSGVCLTVSFQDKENRDAEYQNYANTMKF